MCTEHMVINYSSTSGADRWSSVCGCFVTRRILLTAVRQGRNSLNGSKPRTTWHVVGKQFALRNRARCYLIMVSDKRKLQCNSRPSLRLCLVRGRSAWPATPAHPPAAIFSSVVYEGGSSAKRGREKFLRSYQCSDLGANNLDRR